MDALAGLTARAERQAEGKRSERSGRPRESGPSGAAGRGKAARAERQAEGKRSERKRQAEGKRPELARSGVRDGYSLRRHAVPSRAVRARGEDRGTSGVAVDVDYSTTVYDDR